MTIITLIDTVPFYKLNDNINVISCGKAVNTKNNFISSLQANFQLYSSIKEICKNQSIDIIIGFMTTTYAF